ncbi:heme NO-binding domain-containing protein [Limnobacter parvus]|uniref:Heme NO-binding domain-containing protein n=1 Tax=Limnobacter parvus TaxID=2939690 RepID=A0ABT1XGW0_9BURK|nr:heme NO-binding domain-containing protein [Limnobacter parvus]MCR2746528.1 heme NO-binding domain-containing protein [Limnobacter parvus]
MKGVIFTELFGLIEQTQGEKFLDDLIDACDLPSCGAYTSVGTYNYSEMQTLVTELSKRSGLPAADLLEKFGFHLFKRFHLLYPNLFVDHTCPLHFLTQVELVIHKEVLKLYPEAELPSFNTVAKSTNSLELEYRSKRGLAPLALGLIKGCLAHFGSMGTVTMEVWEEGYNAVLFKIRLNP